MKKYSEEYALDLSIEYAKIPSRIALNDKRLDKSNHFQDGYLKALQECRVEELFQTANNQLEYLKIQASRGLASDQEESLIIIWTNLLSKLETNGE